jgi:hypothetical protein
MRRSSEPEERAQFTVAELLARYGEPAPTSGRRHRRAADDSASVVENGDTALVDTAARPFISSGWTAGLERSAPPPVTDSPDCRDLPQRETPSSNLNGAGDREWSPAVSSPTAPTGRASSFTPSVMSRRAPRTLRAVIEGPATDQLPRVNPAPANPAAWSNQRPSNTLSSNTSNGSSITYSGSTPYSGSTSNGGSASYGAIPQASAAGLDVAGRAVPEQDEHASGATEAQLEEPIEGQEEAQESGSPLWQWVAMASQVGIGVVGGAALWLICEWLWRWHSVVALAVALTVIAGLIWVVRHVRRSEDFQTTLVAVLVGLFITVSPAALLLVGR